MINSFGVNVDTNDLKLNDYGGDSGSIEQVDLTKGEIKYIYQNLENSKTHLSLEKEKLSAIENISTQKITRNGRKIHLI